MDSGDKMLIAAAIISLIFIMLAILYCNKSEGMNDPGLLKTMWTYNSNLNQEYSPNDVLSVITAAQDLAATRARLSDNMPGAGTQLRDGFIGGIEGMPYAPNGSEFRASYKKQLNKLMTEEDQVYYLGRGLSPLYNKDSPYYNNPVKPLMPVSMTSTRKMHETEDSKL